jgi:hypothetical protein
MAPRSPRISTTRPGLHRRVKRGIVAGYLHDLSQRHRPGTPTAVARPATAALDDRLVAPRAGIRLITPGGSRHPAG